MPSLRGITVHVTDHEGKELEEWGVQRLRQNTGKSEKVSAYIQSDTGVQFHVSVQPRIPFVDVDDPESESEVDRIEDMKAGEADYDLKTPRSVQRASGLSQHLRVGSEDRTPKRHRRPGYVKGKPALSSPIRGRNKSRKLPKYRLIASLFLDGRKTPERKIIVYLDPTDKHFAHPDGRVAFKHRWVQSTDGTMTEKAWVFKEKAIESAFDRLMIATTQAREEGRDEDTIIEAMQSSGIGSEDDVGAEHSTVGQIVVELRRVILGDLKYDNNYRSKHQAGDGDNIDMAGMKADVTHATGFASRNTIATSPVQVVDYWKYKPEEGIWATFQFFYRSADQLRKFGFPGFPALQRISKPAGRALNARMAELTPLSIAYPLTRSQAKLKQGIESFEEKINKKNFKAQDKQPRLEFGSEYHGESADEETEVEESHKYPAAPLPFLVPKVPKIGPKRNVTISDLPTLDLSTVSAVASTLTAAISLVDLKQPTVTSPSEGSKAVSPFSARESVLYDRHNHETRLYLSSQPDIGDMSTPQQLPSATPTPHTTPQDPIPPPLSSLTKENLANLNIVSGCGLRIHGETSDADDEDTDDEPKTESDLETHADDEACDYVASAEEDSEGHLVLRSRLKSVAIRKRTYAEIEAEGSERDGFVDQEKEAREHEACRQELETAVLPTMEWGKDEGRNGKKARTVFRHCI